MQQLVQKRKTYFTQGYHSSDNVKFPDNSMTFPWRFLALLAMLSVTHITPILVLLSVVGAGMQQCMIRNQKKIHKLSTGWQGDHSTDNVKFDDNSLTLPWRFATLLRGTQHVEQCYSYHACTSVTVSSGVGMQHCMIQNHVLTQICSLQNSFTQLFPDKIFSLTIPWLLVKSLIFPLPAVKFPDISRFSRQVVKLSAK